MTTTASTVQIKRKSGSCTSRSTASGSCPDKLGPEVSEGFPAASFFAANPGRYASRSPGTPAHARVVDCTASPAARGPGRLLSPKQPRPQAAASCRAAAAPLPVQQLPPTAVQLPPVPSNYTTTTTTTTTTRCRPPSSLCPLALPRPSPASVPYAAAPAGIQWSPARRGTSPL